MAEPYFAPKGFYTWCIVETMPQLRDRYMLSRTTVERLLLEAPADVQKARQECLRQRRAEYGQAGRDTQERNRIGVAHTPTGPLPTRMEVEGAIQSANEAFVARYVEVAKARQWRVWDIAA